MADNDLNSRKAEIEGLVKLAQKEDHDAFSKLYDIFVDHIYRYVYYRVDSVDAEDLTGTVFMKVWENIRSYKAHKKKSFSAWIFRIAHNLVVDYYRSIKDRSYEELNIDVASFEREHNPIKNTEKALENGVLQKAIKRLKKNYQDIIIYKFINEFSNLEIADLLRKSEGSLRILQHRALKALKQELEDMGVKYNF